MTVVVTDDHVSLNNFDVASSIIFDDTIIGAGDGLSNTFFVQGTGSWNGLSKGIGVGGSGTSLATTNLSSTHIYAWINALDSADTQAQGGWRIRVLANSATFNNNYGEWTVGGVDTRRTIIKRFQPFVVDTQRTFDFSTGTAPPMTSVRGVAIITKATTASGQKTWYMDEIKRGSKITVTGGSTANRGKSSEIATDDESDGRGCFMNIGGTFFVMTGITIGDTVASASSFFEDKNKVWVFEGQNVSNSFYTVEFVGGTGTNFVGFGTEVGTGTTAVGVGGNTFAAGGTPPFNFKATDANVSVNLLGCNFLNSSTAGGTIKLEQANVKCLSCVFSQCDTITVRNSAILRKSTITDSSASTTAGALDLGDTNPATDTVRELTIQNCNKGILLKGTTTGVMNYDFRNIKFTGNTNDVRVDYPASATVNINILEGGNTPSVQNVNGSTININNSVNLTITVKTVEGTAVQNARVRIEKQSDNSLISEGNTNSSGVHTTTFNFVSNTPVNIIVRLKGFVPITATGTITSVGLSVDITFQKDTVVDVP